MNKLLLRNGKIIYNKPNESDELLSINELYKYYKSNRNKPIIKNLHKYKLAKESNKPAIIVPFRDNKYQNRTKQLKNFIPYINKNFSKSTIYIIEQSNDNCKFNRGKLLNIGYDIAKKNDHDLYIFHDVDLFPDKISLKYYTFQAEDGATHLAHKWDKYNFSHFFGGANSFTKKIFEKINGFPNDFWGWGGEDDALMNRIIKNELIIYKPDEGKFTELEHNNTSSHQNLKLDTMKKKILILKDLSNWKNNGLSNLKYKIKNKNKNHYEVEL